MKERQEQKSWHSCSPQDQQGASTQSSGPSLSTDTWEQTRCCKPALSLFPSRVMGKSLHLHTSPLSLSDLIANLLSALCWIMADFKLLHQKKLFVSETAHKFSSKTLTWKVRELQATAWVLVQNQSGLQQTPREEARALAARRTASRTVLNPWDTHTWFILFELTLAQVWSKHASRTGQGQYNKHLLWKASFVASSSSQVWEQPAGWSSVVLPLWFFSASTWRGAGAREAGQQPSTQVPAPPASLSHC